MPLRSLKNKKKDIEGNNTESKAADAVNGEMENYVLDLAESQLEACATENESALKNYYLMLLLLGLKSHKLDSIARCYWPVVMCRGSRRPQRKAWSNQSWLMGCVEDISVYSDIENFEEQSIEKFGDSSPKVMFDKQGFKEVEKREVDGEIIARYSTQRMANKPEDGNQVFEYFASVENTIGETLMTPWIDCYSLILIISNLSWWKAIYHDAVYGALGDVFTKGTDLANAHEMAAMGIRNVPPNRVFGNEVYGSDLEGFGMNPSSNEFRLCNSDKWRSGNHGGRVIIRGYGGGGDIVGIRNVPPNGVFGNEVYGSDSEGFGMNPSSNEFRLCNSDEWRSGNHGGRVIIRGYGGGGDMVVRHGLKGCLDHRIIRSSPILPPLP
ncbi:hypothetical protein Tco_0079328 [Tanacetum coccineum]